jgi:putative PEP-CTERM system histidine kinase
VLEHSLRGPAALGYGLAALAFLAFLAHLGFGWRGGRRSAALLAAVAMSVAWAALNLGYSLTGRPALWTVGSIADAARIGCWLFFAIMLLRGHAAPTVLSGEKSPPAAGFAPEAIKDGASANRATAGLIVALLLLPAAAWLLPPAAPLASASSPVAPVRAPYAIFLGAAVLGLTLTEQLFRRTAPQSRWSIKPLCLGLGASFVFDLYMNADALLFGRLDPTIWAARGVAQALVIPFIAIATARNKEWTIDIALSRGVVFNSAALLASGVYLLAVAGAGYYVRYFGGSWGQTFQVGFIFAALLLLGWLFSSGTLRAKLRVFINKNFFSYRYDYRQEWLRFTSLLSTRDPHVGTQQRCIQALANLVESPAGALWLREETGAFTPAARWNLPDLQAREGADSSLPRFLDETGWVVNLDEYREHPSRYPALQLPDWLKKFPSAWLVVPVMVQDTLIGFVILTTARTAIDVNWEVLDLLKTAARQIGSFLGHIQSSEALLEARKFDAFHKMGAFVAHDLKNLVAQLSLLLANAERHRADPRFQADMLSTVRHVVERMNKLLLQLRADARAPESLRPIHLDKVAARIVDSKASPRVRIELETSGEVLALAHEQRLERALGNVVQNAIDATDDGGRVRMEVRACEAGAVVEVADTGCGMSEEFVREKLFRPFQTTKLSGTGIGAYETAQYVRELGGKIEAESRPGSGTRIRIILPLHADVGAAEEQYADRTA